MKKNLYSIILIASFFGGCAASNPFGVGLEHSSCESSSKGGICGAPRNIYKYRESVKKIQSDYLKAGIEQDLFFGISEDGRILVKEKRTGKWQQYDKSKWKKIINERVYQGYDPQTLQNNGENYQEVNTFYDNGYGGQDVPVTKGNDLSLKFNKQSRYIQSRANTGDIIRDNGLIQRTWIAPYVDDKGDLVTAHEVFVVLKKPEWIIGERTPKKLKNSIKNLPTPMSEKILDTTYSSAQEDNVIDSFNMSANIKTEPKSVQVKIPSNDEEILNNFVGE
jgi:hypothetical protein